MTKDEKAYFIVGLTTSIQKWALGKLDHMPEEWDGLELREYLADEFDRNRHMSYKPNKVRFRKRLRDYRNAVLTRPL